MTSSPSPLLTPPPPFSPPLYPFISSPLKQEALPIWSEWIQRSIVLCTTQDNIEHIFQVRIVLLTRVLVNLHAHTCTHTCTHILAHVLTHVRTYAHINWTNQAALACGVPAIREELCVKYVDWVFISRGIKQARKTYKW